MKNSFKILFSFFYISFCLSTSFLFGQEINWYEYELDEIGADFPGEDVYQLDTIIKGIKIKQIYTTFENATLILQKLPAENKLMDENLSKLPYDHKSLIKYYEEVIEGMKISWNAKNLERKEIKFGDFIGYNTIFYNTEEKPINESNTFLIGNHLIVTQYYNNEPFNEAVKEQFFNSLKLEKLDSSNQYSGKSKAFRKGYLFGKLFIYAIIGIGLFFLFRALWKKK